MNSIFKSFLSSSESPEAFSESNFLAAMLRYEAALARAQASVGLIPQAAAQSIIGTCKVELFDVAKIARESGPAGSVSVPLVKSLKETVGLFNQQAVGLVHFGASSRDLIDSAMALVTRDALKVIEADIDRAVAALLALAERHAADPVLERTLMQPISVTSFGLRCAQWAAPLVRSRQRLRLRAAIALTVQWGGAVTTRTRMKGKESQVIALMATDLQLGVPALAWHPQRDEWVALGCELGLLVGSFGKIAKDLALMGQYEVAELTEPSLLAGSSAAAALEPGKPLACMVAMAVAQRTPQAVAALLAAMPQESERGPGDWQVAWTEWPGLLMSTQGAVGAMAQALSGLQVNTQRMRANLEALRTLLPTEQADECFRPELLQQAAELAHAQAAALTVLSRQKQVE